MSVFGKYSEYYDLLYKDKDYKGEADYVASILKRHAPQAKSVLELGCGTGKHAALLAEKGYVMHGVDRSEDMLKSANARIPTLSNHVQQRLSFSSGDVRDCKVNKKFDAVISLFHVVSYQASNDDLLAMFNNAKQHLNAGGIFLFDYWFGPGVLTDRPATRIKHMESDRIEVERIAESILYPKECWVDVNYTIKVRDKKTSEVEELKETHRMRYLFLPEIDLAARATGLRVIESREWLTDKEPSFTSWNAYTVLGA